MRRTILIGEAQPLPGLPAFHGASGRKLERLVGIPPGMLPRFFDTENALSAWPGHTGMQGDAFPAARAAAGVKRLLSTMREGTSAIVASLRLAKALEIAIPPCSWCCAGREEAPIFLGIMPHPSGINRWWNERTNSEEARAFFLLAAAESWMGWAHENDREAHAQCISACAMRVHAQTPSSLAVQLANAQVIMDFAIARERSRA